MLLRDFKNNGKKLELTKDNYASIRLKAMKREEKTWN